MRIGRVVDGAIRKITSAPSLRGERISGLILELAISNHHNGSLRDHSDPLDHSGWNVKGIETCADPLCVEALQAIADIENVRREFPLSK